ncbi:OmpP1/FadL family transporter [Phascolarctobacterium sp.]|uniref:OmpP1/FadL family transporter n=1 Tax=Phascolarctobacterium sp. TaxID=2049039 RepID=UPI00386E4764
MKKQLLALAVAAAFVAPQAVGAEGYAIYEWSAEGLAMGGARMFAEDDAANMAYNPASITKVKGKAAKISATYLSPHGKFDTKGVPGLTPDATSGNRIHPAWAPGTYYVQQLNDKEWIGMGVYSRFGLISQFEPDSIAGTNAFSSKLFGVSTGINYARKLDKKWSASVGAEINYVGLQLDKTQAVGLKDSVLGKGPMHIEGESYALGWNAAANYEFDDKNEMGVVYRSKVKHSMEADLDMHPTIKTPYGAMQVHGYGNAYGVVTLPESVNIGYGHKFNDKTRVEANATWTRWSRYGALDMTFSNIGGALAGFNGLHPQYKGWDDGWRYAIGVEHKLSDKYALMAGFAFDESSIPYEGGDFMIPTGIRKTYSLGVQYKDKDQTLAVSTGWMDVGSLDFVGHPATGDGFTSAHTRDSYTKIYSISYQRNF